MFVWRARSSALLASLSSSTSATALLPLVRNVCASAAVSSSASVSSSSSAAAAAARALCVRSLSSSLSVTTAVSTARVHESVLTAQRSSLLRDSVRDEVNANAPLLRALATQSRSAALFCGELARVDLALELPTAPASDALIDDGLECVKRTYQPSNVRRKRRHGFLRRMRTTDGANVIKRRVQKGRWRISV